MEDQVELTIAVDMRGEDRLRASRERRDNPGGDARWRELPGEHPREDLATIDARANVQNELARGRITGDLAHDDLRANLTAFSFHGRLAITWLLGSWRCKQPRTAPLPEHALALWRDHKQVALAIRVEVEHAGSDHARLRLVLVEDLLAQNALLDAIAPHPARSSREQE